MKLMNTTKVLSILFLGILFSACRPTQKDPPLDMKVARQDVRVDTLTLESRSQLETLGAATIWKTTTGKNPDGTRVKIAIVGTGVDYTIPDLREALWVNPGELGDTKSANQKDDDVNGFADDVIGYDFYSGDAFPYDWHGADTYVASVIAATGRTNSKVLGLAPNAELMIARYIGPDGTANGYDAAMALEYAFHNGAKVIYFNWPQGGFTADADPLILSVFKAAEAKGVPIVVPAGNGSNQNLPRFLMAASKLTNVIVVAGLEADGRLTRTTNYGKAFASVGAPVEAIGYLPGAQVTTELRSTATAAAYATAATALLSTMPKLVSAQKIRAELVSKSRGSKDASAPDILSAGSIYLGN
ncbi:MAG: S8 family serine peptidase [Deltaproteobacteria bacterium]|nr:S8 family serine peptidase [Deltaproteobacteria bacterium]